MLSNVLRDEEKCCGCEACKQICPMSCIEMHRNEEGFLYPQIDNEKCVECGMCKKVCPILNKENVSDSTSYPRTIGGWHKDANVRKKSSSGGAFTLFAQYVLNENGYVFGCTLDDNLHAVHIGVRDEDDLDLLRKSKYVQSEIGNVYKEIYQLVSVKKKVLFVGTPCQAAGLYHFIKNQGNVVDLHGIQENLIICDFICHGVPSPEVFSKYIEMLEKERGSKVVTFSFRCKDHGWKSSGLQLGTETVYDDGEKVRRFPAYKDPYMNGFLDDIYLRKSCYACEFKDSYHYYADITLADFWGVKSLYPHLNNHEGTSLILLHNSRAERLFDMVREKFVYENCISEKVLKRNSPLTKSAEYNVRREKFFRDFKNMEFVDVKRRHMSAWLWAEHKIINMCWKFIQNIIIIIWSFILKICHIEWGKQEWNSFFQFVKFCFVGLSNTIVSYLINMSVLMILRTKEWNFDYIIANLMGFAVAVLWSFHWNSHHVFRMGSQQTSSKAQLLVKTYFSYAFAGIVLNNLLGTLWIRGLGIPKYVSPLINLIFTVPMNFLLNKYWTYNEKKKLEREI